MKKLLPLLLIPFLVFSSCKKDSKKQGCTDPMSLAYNSEAESDDGSCTYPLSTKKALVFKATGTWCPPCGSWGEQYVNDINTQFSSSAEVIAIHSSDAFSVDVGNNFLSILSPSGVPSFFIGLQEYSGGYTGITSLITDELTEANQVSLANIFSIENNIMNIKVQSQLEESFTGENCYLAVYIIEDGQVAPQEVGNPGSGVTDPNFVHNHILRTEATGSTFGQPITFENGKNLTELNATLAPTSLWNYENLYVVAVIWQQNGSDYRFVNLETTKI